LPARLQGYAPGPDGAWCDIQYSTDLLHWTTICTSQVFQGVIDFVDPDAPSNQHRFHRAVPEDHTPSEWALKHREGERPREPELLQRPKRSEIARGRSPSL
jgi:hypothetical protein